jgi:hypothetical protein
MSIEAPEQTSTPPQPPRRPRGRRKPGPPAAWGWRWFYPVLLAGLAVLTIALSATGARLVLDSRDGAVGRAQQDPTKPGYLATVSATPLLLVVHADDSGTLYSVVVMSLGSDDRGGFAVVLSPDTIVQPKKSLADIYKEFNVDDASSGQGVRSAVSALFHADVDTVVSLDATSLAPLIEPVAPLRYTLGSAVRASKGGKTLLPAGPVQIRTPDDVAAATEVLSPGEESIARAQREQQFWQAWIDAVRASADRDRAFPLGQLGTGVVRFVRGLASGDSPARLEQLPIVRYGSAVVADQKAIDQLSLQMIPFPRQEGVRLNVAVLNGLGDPSLNEPMMRKLVAANAQIASEGNPDAFDVATTSVVYHDASIADRAQQLAQAIGATDVRFEEKVDSEIQATVTIGKDFTP